MVTFLGCFLQGIFLSHFFGANIYPSVNRHKMQFLRHCREVLRDKKVSGCNKPHLCMLLW